MIRHTTTFLTPPTTVSRHCLSSCNNRWNATIQRKPGLLPSYRARSSIPPVVVAWRSQRSRQHYFARVYLATAQQNLILPVKPQCGRRSAARGSGHAHPTQHAPLGHRHAVGTIQCHGQKRGSRLACLFKATATVRGLLFQVKEDDMEMFETVLVATD
jgi:hypothetical protein